MTRTRVVTVLAFLAIYVIWGSTYLAIRIAVETVPPLCAAGLRFLLAGSVLYGWARARGGPSPSRLEWRNILMLSTFLFLISYGGVFWAEKTIPSGIVSVLVAIIPLWTAVLQIFVLKKESLRWPLLASICCGIIGVAVLTFAPGSHLQPIACLAVLASGISWAVGTVLSKVLAVPKAMLVNSGAQMLLGGVLLLGFSALLGEWSPLPRISLSAGFAIVYLAVAGSIVAFTAYLWLLSRMKATVVTSYAYLNPVVALLVGHWLGNEALGLRTALGAVLVVFSVIVVIRSGARARE